MDTPEGGAPAQVIDDLAVEDALNQQDQLATDAALAAQRLIGEQQQAEQAAAPIVAETVND